MEAEAPSPSLSQTSARAEVFSSLYVPTAENLDLLAAELRAGGMVALPSETVYGLAADATNASACHAIFALKRRPSFDPLIVHVVDLAMAQRYGVFNPIAAHLAKAFWPGPLTLVVPRTACVPDAVTSGLSTVAIRAPAHPLFRAILQRVKRGLAAPSANPFGYISPTTAEHVATSFGSELKHILDGGPCSLGLESTIVDATDARRVRILRRGAVAQAALEAVLTELPDPPEWIAAPPQADAESTQAVLSPGLLKRHYSPHKPLRLFPFGELPTPTDQPRVAHVYFAQSGGSASNAFALSATGDGDEAAAQLYALLRRLDTEHWDALFVEIPPSGAALADALTDRLLRAAARE